MELLFSNGSGLTLFGITGWAVVFLFILVAIITAWRMYSYTNLAETSPYLHGLEEHEEEEPADVHDGEADQAQLPEDQL